MATSQQRTSGPQSYRDMIQTMKKFQGVISKLQDQVIDLHSNFAEVNFAIATLFDPDVSSIVIGKTPPTVDSDSPINGKENHDIDLKYEDMCEEMTAKVSKQPSQNNC